MKKLVAVLSILVLANQASAALNEPTVISERVVTIPVDISTTQVRFSNAGYGDLQVLKVLVPALADVTLLDHRNAGEAAPCMATYEAASVNEIVQGNPTVEDIQLQITLSKVPTINKRKKICEITLVENLSTKIRGFEFIHSRSKVIATRPVEDCR